MKWSSSTIQPTLSKVPGLGKRDLALGSRGAFQSAPTPTSPKENVMSAPVWAPDFLSNAVNDLNESQMLQAGMQSEWRQQLLKAVQGGDTSLTPALMAASVGSGAKFSYANMGGAGRTGPREPSYWEKKLALKDATQARSDLDLAKRGKEQFSTLGTFMSPTEGSQAMSMYDQDIADASRRVDLANRVLGIQSPGEAGRIAQQQVNSREAQARARYFADEAWNTRSSLMAPEVLKFDQGFNQSGWW